MQTFLPERNFTLALNKLDDKRLGKQRVEAFQILNVLQGKSKSNGWKNHPAVKMWQGYDSALEEYLNVSINLWKLRGFKNTMKPPRVRKHVIYPPWLGDEKFHASHRSNLKRKANESLEKYFSLLAEGKEKRALQQLKVYDWYKQFHWKEDPNLPYVWPV